MKQATFIGILVSVAGLPAYAAGPVQSFSRAGEVTRSEELQSARRLVTAADPRAGLLITPAPFPATRVDGPDREELGRIWHARSPVGNRTPIRELVFGEPGPGAFGAPAEGIAELIWVQPEEIDAVIALSPWQRVDDQTLRQILRQEKNLGRTRFNVSNERLLNELRAAQNQWLEEQGYILNVRTHTNSAAAGATESAATTPASDIQPRGVIRVIPSKPAAKVAQAE